MKRHLLAAAVAALCGAASAQSSVTLFGIVDAGYSHGSGSTSGKTALTSGNNASSRIGFRGREDMGGGLYAAFWLEAQFNTDDGQGVASNANNQGSGAGAAVAGRQGLLFNRRSTVSIGGDWGELRLGRDYTGHYRNRVDLDPFGVVGVGATQVNVGTLAGNTSTRASNAIGYHLLEGKSGFYGSAQYYWGENASGAATSDDGNGYSLRAGYKTGPVNVSAAYARQQFAVAGDIVSTNLGVQYEGDVARVSAGYFRDATRSATPFTGTGYTLGLVVPVSVTEYKIALSRYGSDAGTKPTTRKLSLGAVYNLSRRTGLYATYARVGNSGDATTALNGAVTGKNQSSSGYDLGIRHTF